MMQAMADKGPEKNRQILSVASITTAFNAAHLLPRHITALLQQSRPLQEIVIVDNGSTDGTRELLSREFPMVTVLDGGGNVGAAGGWAVGLAYAALEKKHDWVWSFDDDSIPDAGALEALLTDGVSADADAAIGIVAPLPIHKETQTGYLPMLWRNGFLKPQIEDVLKDDVWYADLVIASGALVSRKVVETIGLPRADFFMDFFDFEYCLRARAHGYKIAVITKCQLSHKIGDAREIRLPGYKKMWPDYPPWREYYFTRNIVYAAWWLHPGAKGFVIKHLLRHVCGVLFFSKHRTKSLIRMFHGAKDGKGAKLGIRFLPKRS